MASLRRPITSCLECYRRKQKCNRLQPCDQCYARKIPSKCFFTHDATSTGAQSADADLEKIKSVDDVVGPAPSSLIDQAGYSASPHSTTFLRLQSKNVTQEDVSSPHKEPPVAHQKRRAAYLQILARLPPPAVIDELLDYLFRDVHLTIMVLDEHCLRNLIGEWRSTPVEQYIGARPKSPESGLRYVPALLFQVLAQILYYLPPQHPAAKALNVINYADRARLSATYYLLGNKTKDILGRQSPTLCSVEYELISAIWLKDSSRGSEAWNRLSDAVR